MPERYEKILLKLSGEALMGKEGFGIDPATMDGIAREIREVTEEGIRVAIVVGGGNIFRGMRAEKQGIDRATGDYIGMLATLMNALALQERLGGLGVPTRVQSALPVPAVVDAYARREALAHLDAGRVVIFACGTGNPFFTTDTAAALRALEIGAGVILKATKVKGVFDRDPEKDEAAVFYPVVSYREVLEKSLKVMDAAAISLCMEHHLPIVVFNLREKGNVKKAALGEHVGTFVRGEG